MCDCAGGPSWRAVGRALRSRRRRGRERVRRSAGSGSTYIPFGTKRIYLVYLVAAQRYNYTAHVPVCGRQARPSCCGAGRRARALDARAVC